MPLLQSPHDAKSTQPLPCHDAPTTGGLWARLRAPLCWPRATQMGLAATGGALAVAAVSMAIGVLVGTAPAPRQFFGPQESDSTVNDALQIVEPNRIGAPEIVAPSANVAAPESSSATEDSPVAIEPDAGLNRDGTGLAALEPQTVDDRRRLETRREEDRIAREKRGLEDQKLAIEAEIERKQLEERRREINRQIIAAREAEDKKRLDDRLAEDQRLLDERRQAETQNVEEKQRALDEQSRQLAEATP